MQRYNSTVGQLEVRAESHAGLAGEEELPEKILGIARMHKLNIPELPHLEA